jgi:hypothetical protein
MWKLESLGMCTNWLCRLSNVHFVKLAYAPKNMVCVPKNLPICISKLGYLSMCSWKLINMFVLGSGTWQCAFHKLENLEKCT